MSESEHHILREQPPAEPVVPALDGSLSLSEKQVDFLLHTIRDVRPGGDDAEAEIKKRVLEVQSKAYQSFPYPCIRAFHHVALFMSENDVFTHVLRACRSVDRVDAPLLLDVGCCMGTDLRHLVHSGYPAMSVIGCDIRQEFIDLGYALYADRDACQIPFFVADVFDITLRPFPQAADGVRPSLKGVRSLDELRGQVKYIYAGALFHLFDEETQAAVARRLATLLDVTGRNGPAVLFGRQAGKEKEGVIDDMMNRSRYAHSPASWKKMWECVLDGNIPVRVDADFHIPEGETSKWWRNPAWGTEIMWWSVCVG